MSLKYMLCENAVSSRLLAVPHRCPQPRPLTFHLPYASGHLPRALRHSVVTHYLEMTKRTQARIRP